MSYDTSTWKTSSGSATASSVGTSAFGSLKVCTVLPLLSEVAGNSLTYKYNTRTAPHQGVRSQWLILLLEVLQCRVCAIPDLTRLSVVLGRLGDIETCAKGEEFRLGGSMLNVSDALVEIQQAILTG